MSDEAKPRVYKNTVPSDREALHAWKQIMDLASKHALILQAYGAVATLAVPSVQRENGGQLRRQALMAVEMNETKEIER